MKAQIKQKIGVISLLPDVGHIMPLLRLAKSFSNYGYKVVCFLPEESVKYTADYQLDIVSIGNVTQRIVDKDVFFRISQQSIFKNAFSNYSELAESYFFPLWLEVASNINSIRNLIEQEQPDILVADSNAGIVMNKLLAAHLNAPIVLHYSEGNLRYCQSPYVSAYGIYNTQPAFQNFIEFLGGISINLHQKFYRKRNEKATLEITSLLKKSFVNFPPKNVKTINVNSGFAILEKARISPTKFNDEFLLFPPIKDNRQNAIENSLVKWLNTEPDVPVVYISLGTMIKGNHKFVKKVIKGVSKIKAKILWAAPKDQQGFFKKLQLPQNIRIEEYVNQPAVLAHKNVKCFVTHGGAGGIQEGMLAGKPMLCIPFIFDQPYNSSIVNSLNTGMSIRKIERTPRKIREKINLLLNEPIYWQNAQQIKVKLEKSDGGSMIIEYLIEHGLLQKQPVN